MSSLDWVGPVVAALAGLLAVVGWISVGRSTRAAHSAAHAAELTEAAKEAARQLYTINVQGNFSGQEVSVNVTAPDKEIAKAVADSAIERAAQEIRPHPAR
jgi:hypothetical protein